MASRLGRSERPGRPGRPLGLGPHTLPAHPPRLPGELLSSWIVALARANGCKVHTLCARFGGNGHTIWNRDVDRQMPPDLIAALARSTGQSVEAVRSDSLPELAVQVIGRHYPNGNSAWVLPLGIYHRKRLGYGVQFCPLCLVEDERPFVRRSWRMAFYTECDKHHVLMQDRCPSCKEPWTYFRGELGDRDRVSAQGINVCSNCGFDLTRTPVQRTDWNDHQLILACRNLWLMHGWGTVYLDNRRFAPVHQLMVAIRQVIMLMSSDRRDGQLYDTVAGVLWPEGYRALSMRGLDYERRSVEERHRLFCMAVWLLLDWPHRFEWMWRASGIHRCALWRDLRHMPRWFEVQAKRAHQ